MFLIPAELYKTNPEINYLGYQISRYARYQQISPAVIFLIPAKIIWNQSRNQVSGYQISNNARYQQIYPVVFFVPAKIIHLEALGKPSSTKTDVFLYIVSGGAFVQCIKNIFVEDGFPYRNWIIFQEIFLTHLKLCICIYAEGRIRRRGNKVTKTLHIF